MKKAKRFLAATAAFYLASCMPYMNTSLNTRQHIRVDEAWLGYVEPLRSNKLTAVAAVDETSSNGATHSIYLATEDGMQFSLDDGLNWSNLTYGDQEIKGVGQIYNQKPSATNDGRIIIAAEGGLFVKYYGSTDVVKIENPRLKRVDLTQDAFRTPSNSPARYTSEDIDAYSIAFNGDDIFIGTTTGLYFCTNFPTRATDNHTTTPTWGNVIGKQIITMAQKTLDYPANTIAGNYKEFNPATGSMNIKVDGTFYTGDAAWAVDLTNYDPIYDPVYNPTFNKVPDFYAEQAIAHLGVVKVVGQPISWAEYVDATYSTATAGQNWSNLTPLEQERQRQARLHYETVLEANDYGNPNNEADGVMRQYAYYRDMRLKTTQIKGVSIYDGVVYLATHGSGISFAEIPAGLDSNITTTYDDEFIWETYGTNYFHYPTNNEGVNKRGEEKSWSFTNIWGLCVYADEKGVFYGATGGGIHFAATYKSARNVLDVNGLSVDYNGNTKFLMKPNGVFDPFNQFYFPELKAAYPNYTKDQIADLYFRADRDAKDGISDENLVQGLRLSWQEYTTRGWSVYTPPGELPPYQRPDYKFPNNTIRKIGFGTLQNAQMVYIATNNGLGVAEARKRYSTDDNLKITASVTGDEQYQVDFVDWGEYHKDVTQLGEQIFVRDFSVTQDADGNDKYIYCATYGQGLVRFRWEAYIQDPLNMEFSDLGL